MGLETVELVMDVEDEFGIRVPDRDAERIETVGMLVEYILTARTAQCKPISYAEVAEKVREWIIRFGVDAREIHDDAHLVFDLGLDARRDVIKARQQFRKAHPFDDAG